MPKRISKKQVLRPLAKKRGLKPWEKIVNFTTDEWFPSRLSFGKCNGRHYQEAREDAELRSCLRIPEKPGFRARSASKFIALDEYSSISLVAFISDGAMVPSA
jgi:hypothetical protein